VKGTSEGEVGLLMSAVSGRSQIDDDDSTAGCTNTTTRNNYAVHYIHRANIALKSIYWQLL